MGRRELQGWLPLLVLVAALIVLFAPLLVADRFLFWGLPTLQFYPWRTFAFEEISAGRLPFLNPYNGAGSPLIANYQSAIFYPPNWLYLLLPGARVMGILAVLHLFWSGVGMWQLTGRLGLNSLGRGVSVLSYALASYGIGRLGSFPTANAVSWLPWLCWGILLIIERRSPAPIGVLSLITAMLLLTGHAQTAFYGFVMGGGLTLWGVTFWIRQITSQHRVIALVRVGSAILLGLGIAAVQLILTTELLAQSQRSGGVDYERLTNLSFAPLRILTVLAPNFFGSPVDGSYLTPEKGIYFEDAIYIGVIPLIGALVALFGWLQRRKFLEYWTSFRSVPLWIGLAIIGFIFALGRHSPVFRWFYDYVPTFDAFREPVRWMILPVFACCILAGIGVQNWGRSARLFFWTRLAGAGGAGMALVALLFNQFAEFDIEAIPVLIQAMIALGGWVVCAAVLTLAQPDETWNVPVSRWQLAVLLVIAADLIWAGQGLNPTVPGRFFREGTFTAPQGRLYWFEDYEQQVKFDTYFVLSDYRPAQRKSAELRNSLLPNLNMLDNVAIFNNFDPLLPRYYARYVELIETQAEQSASLLQAAGVGQVYGAVQPTGWTAIEGADPSYVAPEVPPTAWIVPEARWVEDDTQAASALLAAEWSPAETVILQGEAPENTSLSPLGEIEFFDVLQDSPQEKRFRTVTEGSGYLVLAQAWYPGWSVSIDGQEQPLYQANLAFMAVPIPPGGGEITFRYLPTISAAGVFVTFLSLSISLGLIAIGLIRQVDSN